MGVRTRIRTQIVGVMLLIVIAVMAGMSGVMVLGERRFYEARMHERFEASAQQLRQAARDALILNDSVALINFIQAAGTQPGVIGITLVDDRGLIVADTQAESVGRRFPYPECRSDGDTVSRFPLRSADGAPLVCYCVGFALPQTGRMSACIFVDQRHMDAEMARHLRTYAASMAVMGGGVVVLGLLLTGFLSYLVTKPIALITNATHQIARGNFDAVVSVSRGDEIGALAQDFNAMTKRLKELDELKNTFVSTVTHELRSPLSAVESYVNLIADEARSGTLHNLGEYLTTIRNNTQRLGRFIDNVLTVSRIDARRFSIQRRDHSVTEVVGEIVDLFTPAAAEHKVRLLYEPRPSMRQAAVFDRDKIQQVVSNLISNALKFTPAGGTIAVSSYLGSVRDMGLPHDIAQVFSSRQSAVRTAEWLFISVRDTGCGIPESSRAKLFNRFEQVEENKQYVRGHGGTGLGLALCKHIVEAHGGHIWCASPTGAGSIFSFPVPV